MLTSSKPLMECSILNALNLEKIRGKIHPCALLSDFVALFSVIPGKRAAKSDKRAKLYWKPWPISKCIWMLWFPNPHWEVYLSEAQSEPSQTFEIEVFKKIVNSWKPGNIFTKGSILDFWLRCEYKSALRNYSISKFPDRIIKWGA